MKYIELKQQLKIKIDNVYLISGDDRYLCFDALKKIETALSIQMKDMNSVVLLGESVSANDIVDSANIYPFGDKYRLVVVKNFSPKNSKNDFNIIQNYVNKPLESTILVFFNLEKVDFFKEMKKIININCSKIDAKMLSSFVKNTLAKNEISSNDETIDLLINYCNNDMSKITNELDKLVAYTYDTKILTKDIVEDFVKKSQEFQIYQLSDLIIKNDVKSAIELVDSFSVKAGYGVQIISTLYTCFRRMLFISLNKEVCLSDFSSNFGIKEYAVKVLMNQASKYTSKQLKSIIDLISIYDRKIKNGKMKDGIAVKTIVFSIINIRSQNE